MMDLVFVFCIPWIVLSNVRCWNLLKLTSCIISCLLFFSWTCVLASDESVDKEFLIKSSKVIEAYPHILRRSASGLPDDWECSSVGACDDPVGYEAIRGLHRQLDDDADGSIDVAETDEFLRDELQYENGHKERHKEFHGDDKHINVDELWQAWKTSEVHNWTVEQTVEWLINQVELPQYEHNFRNNGVNGASLPLLAVNTHNFISQNLGIKDSISKQKIALKAMDVVLFGPPKTHNYLKDVVVGVSVAVAAGGCWFALVQHKRSQTHLLRMLRDMEALQRAEDSLSDLQKELNKAKHEQEIVSIEKQDLERRLQDEITTGKLDGGEEQSGGRLLELERELAGTRSELREAERKLEARQWVAPSLLQRWLQLTHELELRSHNAKRQLAEQQLQAAKEGCEKLSKKRGTFMGAFRIAHGSSIDDVDDRIVKAKSALYEVTTDLQERMHRWKQIEVLCGVPIIVNPGLPQLEAMLLKGNGSGLSHSSSDVREESPPPSYPGITPGVLPSSVPPPYSKQESPVVLYPKECYSGVEDSEERSPTPTSLASCPEEQSDTPTCSEVPAAVLLESSNGRVGDFVRKISASLLDKRKKMRKSHSSSNILGESSESSSSLISEEKKKRKFFQTLRQRKQKQ